MFWQFLHSLLCLLEALILRFPPAVFSHYLALKFCLRMSLDVYTGVYETSIALPTTPPIPAKVFRPVRRSHRPPPTYLVIHGLSVSGYHDTRIIQLAKALCGTGATVVAPQLEGLASCEISMSRISEITAVAEVVAKDVNLCPSGRVSAISACITAGFALVAATRTRVIAHALCIGTHASARHLLAHCIATRGATGAMYAIEAAFLSTWAGDDTELKAIFHASLADDHHLIKDTPEATLPHFVKKYPRAGRLYEQVISDFAETKKVLEMIYERDRKLWEGVSPLLCVRDIGCRSVTLVHSASDGIVPPHESRLLYQAIRKTNPRIKAAMKITELLDHGDKAAFGVSVIPELLVLVKTLSNFFRYSWE